MKVAHAEADDLPNLGRNASSIQSEGMEDRRRCGDVAAKTSEYAFFKRLKQNRCNSAHIHRKHHDNQLDNVQQNDHFTKEENPNVKKEITKRSRSSDPVLKEQDDAQHSFLSTPCGSKNFEVNNAFGAGGRNAHNVRPGEYNWLSPSEGSKTKTPGDKGVFSAKREKLRQWAFSSNSQYDANEPSSKGIDLVSALMSRILPKDQENDWGRDQLPCHAETDSRCKLPSFSEPETVALINGHEPYKRKWTDPHHRSFSDDGFSKLPSFSELEAVTLINGHEAYKRKKTDSHHRSYLDDGFSKLPSCSEPEAVTLINGHEAYKRKRIDSHHRSYLEDGFSRSRTLKDTNLLSWDRLGSESCSTGHVTRCKPELEAAMLIEGHEAYKRKWNESHRRSYFDDGLSRSTGRLVDTNLLEWDPTRTESCSADHASKSGFHSFRFDHAHTEGGSRIPNFIERISSFDELHPGYESSRFRELVESYSDDDFSRLADTGLLESDLTGIQSCSTHHAPKSRIRYDHCHSEDGFRIPNFAIDRISSFDESHPGYESSEFKELEESYSDDCFSRSTRRLVDVNLLALDPMVSESYSAVHATESILSFDELRPTYESSSFKELEDSYLDDGFAKSTGRLVDMSLLESCSADHAPKSSIRYNYSRVECGFRIPNFSLKRMVSFAEPLPRYKSSNMSEESDFRNEPKLLEQPRPLLLGWEGNRYKDDSQLSALDSHTDLNTFSTSEDDGHHILDGVITPYINSHLKEERFPPSLTLPVEDRSMDTPPRDHTWCPNESSHEKEPFLLLIQSPGDHLLRSLNAGLRSFVVDGSSEEEFVYGQDHLLEGGMRDYHSSNYPLLLHDSSKDE